MKVLAASKSPALSKQLEKAIQGVKGKIRSLGNDQNPQVVALRRKWEGSLEALEAVQNTIKGQKFDDLSIYD